MRSIGRGILFGGAALAVSLLVSVWTATPAHAQAVCGNGVVQGGEECDPGGPLHVDGDPDKATCTTGNDCFYAYSCCKFNCQYVGSGAPCDDGDECTSPDVCDQVGQCIGTGNSVNGTPCDDGLFCNGSETCTNGVCGSPSGNPCPGTECNACQEDTQTCFDPAGTTCTAGGNVCLTSECDGAGTCSGVPNSEPCDDGIFCNGADTCSGGTCSIHAGEPCVGGSVCANVCDEEGQTCNLPGGTACTDDGNACTDDICDGDGSCQHENNSAPCDDGIFCNGADTCSGGTCSVHAGDPCNDGVACTDDACEEMSASCSNVPNDANCDDGLFCNGAETCDSVADCQAGEDPCDDSNSCTTDTCDEGLDTCGTVPLPELAACEDGDLCTIDDQCIGGSCVGNAPLLIDFCPWVMVVQEDPKGDKLKTGRSSDVDGDICGGIVILGASSTNRGDVVSGLASGSGAIRVSPAAAMLEDIVTAGGGAKGKGSTVQLPYTSVTRLAPGSVTAKNDASGTYDLSGGHPLSAECVAARNGFAAIETALDALPSTSNAGSIRVGSNQIVPLTATSPGGINVIDIEGLRTGRASVLELDGAGDPATTIVLRIAGKAQMALQGSISLIGGLTPERVLIYGKGKKCQFGDSFAGAGTLFCSGGRVKLGRQVAWDGAIFAGGKILRVGDNDVVQWVPFQAF